MNLHCTSLSLPGKFLDNTTNFQLSNPYAHRQQGCSVNRDIENRFYMNPTTQYTKNWSVLVNDIYLIIPDKDLP